MRRSENIGERITVVAHHFDPDKQWKRVAEYLNYPYQHVD